jgi:hypothetical protein
MKERAARRLRARQSQHRRGTNIPVGFAALAGASVCSHHCGASNTPNDRIESPSNGGASLRGRSTPFDGGASIGDATTPGDRSPPDSASFDSGVPSVGDGDFTIGPSYTPAPETVRTPDVPQGTVNQFSLSSTQSKIYPTDYATHMPFTRSVWVYVPTQYKPGAAAPFIVVQDGNYYVNTMTVVLDNLIHARELPVMIAVFVDPGPTKPPPTASGASNTTRSRTPI